MSLVEKFPQNYFNNVLIEFNIESSVTNFSN